jgi:hypothetical protein
VTRDAGAHDLFLADWGLTVLLLPPKCAGDLLKVSVRA